MRKEFRGKRDVRGAVWRLRTSHIASGIVKKVTELWRSKFHNVNSSVGLIYINEFATLEELLYWMKEHVRKVDELNKVKVAAAAMFHLWINRNMHMHEGKGLNVKALHEIYMLLLLTTLQVLAPISRPLGVFSAFRGCL
ncbi:hypothetical protein HPP92_009266 [Vanilla planifolia]|uniref:Uncharacterized protein n=1 Tax=Vanilla planifolia TaxID=51239 RepID=A0A835RFW4_VANPL|nr:hypothetical protein HPP92_009266 [Vanilla planifolia]